MERTASNEVIGKLKYLLGEYHLIFLGLLAALLPFRAFGANSGFNPMPVIIVVWGLIWLIEALVRWKWSSFRLSSDSLLAAGYVLVAALSLIYSENISEGWSKVQVRLSLLFLPLFMMSLSLSIKDVRALIRLFIISNAMASLVLLLRASIRHADRGWNAFFYSDFSYFLHPSYFALYLSVCLIFLILVDGMPGWSRWLRIFLSLFFLVIIYLCSSRAGILAGIVVTAFSLFRSPLFGRKAVKWLMICFLLMLGVLASFLNYRTNSAAMGATAVVQQNGNPRKLLKTVENTTSPARVMIWNSALDLFKPQWLLGYGIGDVQDELSASYEKRGFTVAAEKRLNAHNQYLQSMLESGVPGILALLLLLIPWRRMATWRSSAIGIAILLAVGVHLLFESMLNTQAGIILLAWIMVLMPHLHGHPEKIDGTLPAS